MRGSLPRCASALLSARLEVAMVRIRSCARLALVLLGLAPLAGHAQSVAVNDTLTPIVLEDQHGRPGGVDAATRAVLLSRDMDGGGLVREALATDGAARLERAGAAYVADVHAMPGLVRRFIALPRMRERPYRVLLDLDGGPTARLPAEAGKATWLRLDGLRVVEVRFLTSTDEVRAALGVPSGS
jgi:hypothetical protein